MKQNFNTEIQSNTWGEVDELAKTATLDELKSLRATFGKDDNSYPVRKLDFYIFNMTKKKGMYFFELMDQSQIEDYTIEWFYDKPRSNMDNWLMLHEFKTFQQFIEASFPLKTSSLGFKHWLDVIVQYNVEFPVPEHFKRFGR